jgi:predicted DNA-binding transcriptional regulator AlpA
MGREILQAEAAEIAGVAYRTFAGYVTRGQAPKPSRYISRTPLWDEDEVRSWAENRPGRGSKSTERALRRASERTTAAPDTPPA